MTLGLRLGDRMLIRLNWAEVSTSVTLDINSGPSVLKLQCSSMVKSVDFGVGGGGGPNSMIV